jgi:hypothetical protein
MKNILTSLFIFLGITIFSQNLQVSGKVADEKGVPIDYAEITFSIKDSLIQSEITKENSISIFIIYNCLFK